MTFEGTILFRNYDDTIMRWNSTEGWSVLVGNNSTMAPIPTGFSSSRSFGGIVQVAPNKFLVALQNPGAAVTGGFFMDSELNPLGTFGPITPAVSFGNSSQLFYADYDMISGVYEEATGLAWVNFTYAGHPWCFTGIDSNGDYVTGYGNPDLIVGTPGVVGPLGDAYAGQYSEGAFAVDGSKLWRELRYTDGVSIYDRATDTWEVGLHTVHSWPGQYGTDSAQVNHFIGYDSVTDKMINVTEYRPQDPSYANDAGAIEIYDPSVLPTQNPVPNGAYGLATLPDPEVKYSTSGLGSATVVGPDSASDYFRVKDGYLYFLASLPYDSYGVNEDGSLWGNVGEIWRLNLSDASREKITDIPYMFWSQSGVRGVNGNTDPWYVDSRLQQPAGLQVIIGTLPPLTRLGRGKINVGTDEDRHWLYACNHSGGTQVDTGGNMRVNLGDDVDRVWKHVCPTVNGDGTGLKVNLGTEDAPAYVYFCDGTE